MSPLDQLLGRLELNQDGYCGRIGSIDIEIIPSPNGWESIVRTEGISFVAEGSTPQQALALTLEELV